MEGLENMDMPITTKEIDYVIREMAFGKSLGPDGFNTYFMKKCWGVIAQDFYHLCLEFYNHNICRRSINGSYITVVPKIDNPSKVNDFGPMSLLNSSIKLITKVLANRLQRVIMGIIHQNQYMDLSKVEIYKIA
jgi:hypothetical protein